MAFRLCRDLIHGKADKGLRGFLPRCQDDGTIGAPIAGHNFLRNSKHAVAG